jgi:hypothetical protein
MSARRLLHFLEGLGAVIAYALFRLLPLDTASALGGFLGRSIGPHLDKYRPYAGDGAASSGPNSRRRAASRRGA